MGRMVQADDGGPVHGVASHATSASRSRVNHVRVRAKETHPLATMGRICARVVADELDPDRLDQLLEIGLNVKGYRGAEGGGARRWARSCGYSIHPSSGATIRRCTRSCVDAGELEIEAEVTG